MGVEKEVKAAGDGKWEYLKGQKMPKDIFVQSCVEREKVHRSWQERMCFGGFQYL